jgi:phosphatidylglycerophosphatase A
LIAYGFKESLTAGVKTMYIDEVVLAGIAAIGLCIAFFIGFTAFIVNDARKDRLKAESREKQPLD